MYKFGNTITVGEKTRQPTLKFHSHWVKTTIEFYNWKKTDDFIKWKKKQFLKQGGLCYYCQTYLPMARVNVEHKTARSLGGRNNKNNLVLSCADCNKKKGSKPLMPAERARLKKQNKRLAGTYLRNKEYYENTYGQYADDAIIQRLKLLE